MHLSYRNIKKVLSLMVTPEFGNALPQLGHNTAQIVDTEAREDNYKMKILSWIGI